MVLTYLLFGDECRWGTASDLTLCAYGDDAWRLLSWRLFGETEFKEWYIGVFWEQLCTYMAEENSGRGVYTKTTWRRCNAILHSMQPWTLNPKVNPTLSLPSSFFPPIWFLYTHIACVKNIILCSLNLPTTPFSCTQLLLLVLTH